MDTVIIILVTLFIIGIGVVFNFYVKDHTRKSILESSKTILKLINLILLKNVPDAETRKKMNAIFDAIDSTIEFVEKEHYSKNVKEKKEIAIEHIHNKMTILNIKLDDESIELIELLVDNAYSILEKKGLK